MALDSPTSEPAHQQSPPVRFVYVIAPERGPVKIGLSKSPERRMREILTHNPTSLRIVFQLPLSEADAFQTEAHVHWMLRDRQVSGEWFAIAPEQAAEAVQSAWAEVQSGRGRTERAPCKGKRVCKDGLTLMFLGGLIDLRLYEIGELYRRAYRLTQQSDVKFGRRRRLGAAEASIDARRWMDRTEATLRREAGSDAAACFRLVVIEGRALAGVTKGRGWERLADIVRRGLETAILSRPVIEAAY